MWPYLITNPSPVVMNIPVKFGNVISGHSMIFAKSLISQNLKYQVPEIWEKVIGIKNGISYLQRF
jgi:hypothetical protein